jgi:hypothetical protein
MSRKNIDFMPVSVGLKGVFTDKITLNRHYSALTINILVPLCFLLKNGT